MSKRNRTIIAALSLVMLAMYVTPLWRITLEAPQYPEGLGLHIMLDTVVGQNEHDLQNINNLNHYIGMKRIVPESIPELRIMPWAIAFLIGLGLITAFTGNRKLLYSWAGLFVILAVAGLVDFYLWEYDYGHNLDLENAAIKIPGMSYQPPLIGSKQLLNFKAYSWPGMGGWIAMVACVGGVLIAWSTFRENRGSNVVSAVKANAGKVGRSMAAVLILGTVGIAGCSNGPQPFHLGVDQGSFCRMTISDAQFATQIVTRTGRSVKFDSIECMIGYMNNPSLDLDGATYWVSDYLNPDVILNVDEATFLRSENIMSPMGGGVAAFSAAAEAESLAGTFKPVSSDGPGGSQILTWDELRRHLSSDAMHLTKK